MPPACLLQRGAMAHTSTPNLGLGCSARVRIAFPESSQADAEQLKLPPGTAQASRFRLLPEP